MARLLIGLGVLAFVVGGVLGVQRAGAILQEVQATGLPGYLSLRSAPADPYWKDLSPGETAHWLIEASLTDAPSSTLALEMRSSGALADTARLHVDVTSCTEPFTVPHAGAAPACDSGEQLIVSSQPLTKISSADDGTVFTLATLTTEAPRHVLVRLHVTGPPEGSQRETASIGVGFTATGEDHSPIVPEPPHLAATGRDVSVLALLAAGILLIGVGIAMSTRTGTATMKCSPPHGGDA